MLYSHAPSAQAEPDVNICSVYKIKPTLDLPLTSLFMLLRESLLSRSLRARYFLQIATVLDAKMHHKILAIKGMVHDLAPASLISLPSDNILDI